MFENLVFVELDRAFHCRGLAPACTFFRSSDGLEVDFLIECDGRLFPIEVKRAATPRREMADGIAKLKRLLGDVLGAGLVILLGERGPFPLSRDCDAVGFEAIG